MGCPRHPEYDDERVTYERTDAPDERGPASFWVGDTYAQAARDAGVRGDDALREGIAEFTAALKRREIRKAGRG